MAFAEPWRAPNFVEGCKDVLEKFYQLIFLLLENFTPSEKRFMKFGRYLYQKYPLFYRVNLAYYQASFAPLQALFYHQAYATGTRLNPGRRLRCQLHSGAIRVKPRGRNPVPYFSSSRRDTLITWSSDPKGAASESKLSTPLLTSRNVLQNLPLSRWKAAAQFLLLLTAPRSSCRVFQ
jgi:hypothetical protein